VAIEHPFCPRLALTIETLVESMGNCPAYSFEKWEKTVDPLQEVREFDPLYKFVTDVKK